MIEEFEILSLDSQELDGQLLSLNYNSIGLNHNHDFPVVRAVFNIATKIGFKIGHMLSWDAHFSKIDELSVGKHYRFTAAVNENEGKLLLFFLPHKTVFELSGDLKEERS